MLQPVIELEFDYDDIDIDIDIALTICMKFFFLQLSLILKLISFCLSAFGIEKIIMVFFSLSGIRPFDTEEEMQQYFQRHKKNRDFAVIFKQDGSNGQLNYTIRTRNNNFRTEQIYLNNIYEIANRGE